MMPLAFCPILCLAFLFNYTPLQAQSYTSYFYGQPDTVVTPSGGLCLMGGATESDEAMQWFLQRANGGDVLVLRATGGNGYNNYFYQTLGVPINSVETIVFHHASAAYDLYVQRKIAQAEAIWIAGGDQWDYIQYWRNSPVDSLINLKIQQQNLVLGGTSAGMAIQGGVYFSAQNGTVSSAAALANPYDNRVTIDTTAFLHNPFVEEVIMDTHYDNPSREGRQLTFMARMLQDYGFGAAKGIACEEYTAVCIDSNGVARVFGDYPNYDDNAYFLQVNPALSTPLPEQCQANSPLIWNHNGQAVLVYQIKGTSTANNSFDLKDWCTGTGGTWQQWSINSSQTLSKAAAAAPSCFVLNQVALPSTPSIQLYPNPCGEVLHLEAPALKGVTVYNALGGVVWEKELLGATSCSIPTHALPQGCYWIKGQSEGKSFSQAFLKQ